MIFYEAPHKLLNTLKDLYGMLGNRKVCLLRELTKIYEEQKYTTLEELIYSIEKDGIKGEIVFILEGNRNKEIINEGDTDKSNLELVKDYIKLGLSKNNAIKKVAKERGLSKNEVYMECVKDE